MDNFMVDLSRVPYARVGDTVTLLGGESEETSAARVAQLARTIPYEIFCRIGNRVQRVAKG
jgi:alanine racemase